MFTQEVCIITIIIIIKIVLIYYKIVKNTNFLFLYIIYLNF